MIAILLAAALAPAPLGVALPAAVRGDGRTATPIEMIGPGPLEAEDPRFSDVGSISCEGASALSATETVPPRILPPATATTKQLACVARRRGGEAAFSLRVDPPGPGLYAALLPVRELSAWHLYQIVPTGQKISYSPTAPSASRQAAQNAWFAVVPRGQMPRQAAPAIPAAKKT